MSEKCEEIEILQEKHDAFNVHENVKDMTNWTRKYQIPILRDANNEIILGIEAKLRRWKEYLEELLDDDRPVEPPQTIENMNKTGPEITKGEVIHAIKAQKNG